MIAQAIFAPSAYRAPSPLNWQFNVSVRALASLHAPGWIASDNAPDTYAGAIEAMNTQGRVVVWTGASGGTIFDDQETNWAFRAWHDATHIRHALPFTPEGEAATAYVQAADLVAEYGDDTDVVEMVALLFCEVIGQVAHVTKTGAFPADQMAFARRNWRKYLGEAARVVGGLGHYTRPEKREARALALANKRLRLAR
jgi:hypothetical protein